jgi:hypothetical protein
VRQAHAFLHVAVEADALGHAEGGRLAHVVQQGAQRQRKRGMAQPFEQQQRVHPDVAFGMIFRRLLHAFHGRHFGQDLGQQAARVQQFEAAARAAFGEDARQFVADAFGGDLADQRVVALDGGERGGSMANPRRAAKRTARSRRR